MLKNQLLESIINSSKKDRIDKPIIVNLSILLVIISKLSNSDTISLLKTFGPFIPLENEIDGKWCREIREILNISQVDLAKDCRVNQCDISNLEKEKTDRIDIKSKRKKRIQEELIKKFTEFLKL